MPEKAYVSSEMSRSTPSQWVFFRAWCALSLQSFGGGPATLTLIHRAMVEQSGWVSEGEFSRYWALVQVAPGINLLALTILIGRRVNGPAGVMTALLGLLLPSVTITVLITAYYARIQRLPIVAAAVRGVLAATVGVGLYTAVQMARSLLGDRTGRGIGPLLFGMSLLIGSGVAAFKGHMPVVLVLLASGALGAVWAAVQNSIGGKNGTPDQYHTESPRT